MPWLDPLGYQRRPRQISKPYHYERIFDSLADVPVSLPLVYLVLFSPGPVGS